MTASQPMPANTKTVAEAWRDLAANAPGKCLSPMSATAKEKITERVLARCRKENVFGVEGVATIVDEELFDWLHIACLVERFALEAEEIHMKALLKAPGASAAARAI